MGAAKPGRTANARRPGRAIQVAFLGRPGQDGDSPLSRSGRPGDSAKLSRRSARGQYAQSQRDHPGHRGRGSGRGGDAHRNTNPLSRSRDGGRRGQPVPCSAFHDCRNLATTPAIAVPAGFLHARPDPAPDVHQRRSSASVRGRRADSVHQPHQPHRHHPAGGPSGRPRRPRPPPRPCLTPPPPPTPPPTTPPPTPAPPSTAPSTTAPPTTEPPTTEPPTTEPPTTEP